MIGRVTQQLNNEINVSTFYSMLKNVGTQQGKNEKMSAHFTDKKDVIQDTEDVQDA